MNRKDIAEEITREIWIVYLLETICKKIFKQIRLISNKYFETELYLKKS